MTKTRIKNISRRSLSMVLALLMMVSIIMVGTISANAYDFTSGKTVYFDNSWTQWSKVYLRVGKDNYNNAYQMSKVSGTNNIYSYTIPSWGGYAAFAVANNCSWTGSNSIYTVNTGDSYAITKSTNYLKFSVSSNIMIVPKSTNNTSDGCTYYNVCGVGNATASDSSQSTFTTLNKSVSVASVSNGTVTATYTSGSGGTINEGGSASILYGSTLTISQTPDDGYYAGNYTATCANNSSSTSLSSSTCYVGYHTTPTTECSITGSFGECKYYLGGLAASWETTEMTRQSDGWYKATKALKGNAATKYSAETTNYYGYKVVDDHNNTYYRCTDSITATVTKTSPKTLVSSNGDNSSLTTINTGNTTDTYTFFYKPSTNQFAVYYPSKVTFNANGHGTAPTAQYIAYEGKASTPTAPSATGYTFGGWYKEAACTNAWNFSTDTVTSATTLYAKWTAINYTITDARTSGTTADMYSFTGTTTAHYQGSPTFTLSANTGYTIDSITVKDASNNNVAYTKSGSTYTITSMPASNVTVTITAHLNTYAITLSESGAGGEPGTLQVDNSAFTSGNTVTHGNHTFRIDAPNGYEIDTISGIGTWTKSSNELYATLGSTTITSAQTITVTYKVSTSPAIRVNYTGSSGAASANSGTVTTTTLDTVTVTFTNQSALTNGAAYSVTYTKDGGSSQSLISGTISSSGGELQAFNNTLTAGTYVFTVTVGTKSTSITVEVLSAYKLTVAAAKNHSSLSTAIADSYYTNVFSDTVTAITGAGTYYCKPSTAYSVKYNISNSAEYTFSSNQTTLTTTKTLSGTISSNQSPAAPTVYNRLYAVTVPSNAAYTISGITTGNYGYNYSTSFTVTPNTGYQIDSVSGTGVTSNGNNSYTITVTSATSITVTSSIITPTIKVITNKDPSGVTPSSATSWTQTYIDGGEDTITVQTNYTSYPAGAIVQFVKYNSDALHGTFSSNSLTVNSSNIDSHYYYAVKVTIDGQSVKSGRVYIYKHPTVQISLPSVAHGTVTATYTNAYDQSATLTEGNTVYAKKDTDVTINVSDIDTDYEIKSITDGTTTYTTSGSTFSSVSSNKTYTVTIGEIDYIYFYAALQKSWGSNPIVTVGGEEVTALQVIHGSGSEVTLYNGRGSDTKLLEVENENEYKFRVSLFRVNANKAGQTVTVGNSTSGGGCVTADTNYTYTMPSSSGYLYYTHSTGGNYCGRISPQQVAISQISATAVGTYNNLNVYDTTSNLSVKVDKTKFYYNGSSNYTQTAGRDSTKLTYEVYKDNGSSDDTLVYTLSNQSFAETKSLSLANVKTGTGFVNGGEYYVKVTTVDNTSGKIKQVSGESTHFYIEDQFTVTVSGKKTDNTEIAQATPSFTADGTDVANNGTFLAGTSNTKTVVAADLTSKGYQFDSWAVSGGVSVSTTSNRTTTVSATATGTLTAKYSLITYTVTTGKNSTNSSNTVEFKVNSASTQYTSKNNVTVEDTITPVVVVNSSAGYKISSVKFNKTSGGATQHTFTNSGTDTSPTYSATQMKPYNMTVYATYGAITPVMANSISATVDSGNTEFSASGYTLSNVYANQDVTITPSVTTAGIISYASSNLNNGYGTASLTYNSSTKKFTFTSPKNIGTTADANPTYTFRITPTNTPEEGISVSGTYKTVTVTVKYSPTQKAYMNLKSTYDTYTGYGITSDDIESGWSDFNSAMTTANTALGTFPNDLPVWNASDTYTTVKTSLEDAYDALVFKTNTIYVLSQYSSDVKLHTYNRSGFFSTDATLSSTGNDGGKGFVMTLEGTTNSGKYLFSMTYQGKCDFIVYKVSGSTIVATANKLSDNITLATTTTSSNIAYNTSTSKYVYGEYYLDLKDKSTGSTSFGLSSVTEFADFGDSCISATGASGDDDMVGQCEEGDEGYSVSTLTSKLGVSYSGASLVTSSQTVNTTFSITGPARGESSTVTVDSSHNWVPTKPGRYTVVVNASLGTDSRASEGATFTGTKSTVGNTSTVLSLFVAYDDIEIYADMNGNVGTPTIHFTYTYTDNQNQIQTADLPYEFDMVTGSESIYSYTISVSTLKDVYGLDLLNDTVTVGGQTYHGIKIDHISIDNVNIDNSSFAIERSAARTGTLWLKADSSHMKTFNKIAYGSSTRTFKAVLRTTDENNATTNTDFNNTFAEVNGTGIITDGLVGDSYQYSSFYAAKDATANYNFSYTLRVKAETDITHKDGNNTNYYYFDHWERINGNTTTTTGLSEANGADVNILSAPNYDTDADVTYVAVYKLTSTQKRVQITYKFKDYNTDDGNYVFDETLNAQGTDYLNVKDATYTKTVNWNGTTALATVAQNNCPIIKSNYFDYTFDAETANVTTTQAEDNNTKKTCIEATLKHTPHKYKIIYGSTVYKGYYQQTHTFTGNSNSTWYIKDANNNQITIGAGATYNARFGIYQDADTETENNVSYKYDKYTIYVKTGTPSAYSSIAPAHQETYYDQDTPKARHNFYIIDAMGSTSGEFVGAGVLYATTDSSGNYRQTNAGTVLGNNNSDNKISNYITGILNPNNNINTAKYGTEFKAQTINNIGFRYLPYSGNESIIRYSNELSAYMYTFAGENTNSSSLNGQKLRVFSFFVYKNGNAYTNVVSSMYAEVDRYIAPPDPNPNS